MPTNPFYQTTGNPAAQTRGSSALIRNEMALIQAGFDGVNTQFAATATSIATKGNIAGQAWTGTHDFRGAAEVEVPAPVNPADAVTLQTLTNAVSSAAATLSWVSGTAYTVGQVVYSPMTFQNYRRVAAGAGTLDPSLDAVNWVTLPLVKTINGNAIVGSGNLNTTLVPRGETVQNSATSIMLTTASTQVQAVSMTVAGLAVMLPAANTFATVGDCFLVRNAGTLAFDIQDNSGTIVFGQLQPNSSVLVWLRDNTTAAGLWSFLSSQAIQTALITGLSSSLGGVTGATTICICPLNATQFLACYQNANWYCVVGTVTPGAQTSISFGAPTAIVASTASYSNIACCQVAPNNAAIVLCNNAPNTQLYAVTTSGTNIALSQPVSVGLTAGVLMTQALAICLVSANTVLITIQAATNGIYSVVATVNGLNVALNNNAYPFWKNVCSASGTIANSLVNIGNNAVLAAVQDATSGNIYGMIYTLSGGVYTASAPVLLVSASFKSNPISCCFIGNNQALLFFNDGANNNYCSSLLLNIGGNTITTSTKQQIVANTNLITASCGMTTGAALVCISPTSGASTLYGITVTGSTTINVGPGTAATTTSGFNPSTLVNTNTNKAVFAFYAGTAALYAAVVSMTGTSVTYNAPVALAGVSTVGGYCSACQTNTDQAVIGYYNTTTAAGCAATVSSATPTANWGVPQTTQAGANVIVVQSAATGAFLAISGSTMNGCTVSGGSITVGALATASLLSNGVAGSNQIAAMAAPGYVLFANSLSGSEVDLIAATANGTNATAVNLPSLMDTGSPSIASIVLAPSGTGNACIVYNGAAITKAVYATVSGVVVTYSNALTLNGSSTTSSCAVTATSTSNAFVAGYNGGASTDNLAVLTYNAGSLSAGNPLALGSIWGGGGCPGYTSNWLTQLNANTIAAADMPVSGAYNLSLVTINGSNLSLVQGFPQSVTATGLVNRGNLIGIGGNKLIMYYSNSANGSFGQAIQFVKV